MQTTLFGRGAPAVRTAAHGIRIDLGRGAWVEHVPGYLAGQDRLFEQIRHTTNWKSQQRTMYERVVDVPRLLGSPEPEVLPTLEAVADQLERQYGWSFDRISLALYRDGQDSVAFHGDRMGALKPDCVLAILSLGSERTFLLRPSGGGRGRSLRFVGGDLLVMGGTAQDTWEHSVPKVVFAGVRIAVMFRPSAAPATSATG